jgi:hypothetical protein
MNLNLLQRFAPLISVASKRSGDLTDAELSGVATALTGDASAQFLPLLQMLKAKEPNAPVTELLGSDAAKNLFARLEQSNKEVDNTAFIKCPHCERLFETELS